MKHWIFIFNVVLFYSCMNIGYGQVNLGMETQAYPTGMIPGIRLEFQSSSNDLFHTRIGYQFIDHRDLGIHDEETGNGAGLTLGYLRKLNDKWSFGIRTDLWWNRIDWKDINGGQEVKGQTKIKVLQPTMILEYVVYECEHWIIAPSLGFGLEWNIKTEGAPTGEGPIALLGIKVLKKM